jgi:hypothetical protein
MPSDTYIAHLEVILGAGTDGALEATRRADALAQKLTRSAEVISVEVLSVEPETCESV